MTRGPVLREWDLVVVNTSAGKDSLAMLDRVCELARVADALDRVVAVHADLGRVEWPGTRELAERQASAQGIRFEVCTRIGGTAAADGKRYRAGETHGDLLDYVRRNRHWPRAETRYCTSEFKRAPIIRTLTKLVNRWREAQWHAACVTKIAPRRSRLRACRILQCLGMRAQESPARAKRAPWSLDERASNSRREVWQWLPIHDWTEDAVWERIRSRGLEYHPAYDLGMPRLSCSFCIFAPPAALMVAGRARPGMLAEYVAVEREIGHAFRHRLPIASIAEAIERGDAVNDADLTTAWAM